jgi:GH43 family beta-xylosidase
MKIQFLLSILFLAFSCNQSNPTSKTPVHAANEGPAELSELTLDKIRIRDPYIVPDASTTTYYMYAQMENRADAKAKGVEVYSSKDLKTWTGPDPVFTLPEGFWANHQVWAPEVHMYKDKYYLFVTLSNSDTLATPRPIQTEEWPKLVKRASQVFVSDSPRGPFKPFENKPHTPVGWTSLDGTLFVEDGIPYMIFCHEWTQVVDGTMELVRLSDDLSAPVNAPLTLFKAGDASWVTPLHEHGKITDGPFLYKTSSGKLIMIWSSFGTHGYAIGQAISENGRIAGPWTQADLIFKENGGHGMIFKTFDDQLVLLFHQPNIGPQERAMMYLIKEVDDRLVLVSKLYG